MKTLRTLLLGSSLVIAVAANAAWAETPRAHGPFHGIELTAEQKEQIRSIHASFYQEAKASRAEHTDAHKLHKKPATLDKKTRDEKKIANGKSQVKHERSAHSRANPELRLLIQAERFDEVAVRAVLEQQNKKRIEAQVQRAKLQHAVYNVLTQEQKDILAAQEKTRAEKTPQALIR